MDAGVGPITIGADTVGASGLEDAHMVEIVWVLSTHRNLPRFTTFSIETLGFCALLQMVAHLFQLKMPPMSFGCRDTRRVDPMGELKMGIHVKGVGINERRRKRQGDRGRRGGKGSYVPTEAC